MSSRSSRLPLGPSRASTLPALLALGSRQTGAFYAGQGTELLAFLSRVLEVTFRAWLHLPPKS